MPRERPAGQTHVGGNPVSVGLRWTRLDYFLTYHTWRRCHRAHLPLFWLDHHKYIHWESVQDYENDAIDLVLKNTLPLEVNVDLLCFSDFLAFNIQTVKREIEESPRTSSIDQAPAKRNDCTSLSVASSKNNVGSSVWCNKQYEHLPTHLFQEMFTDECHWEQVWVSLGAGLYSPLRTVISLLDSSRRGTVNWITSEENSHQHAR